MSPYEAEINEVLNIFYFLLTFFLAASNKSPLHPIKLHSTYTCYNLLFYP